MKGRGNGYTLEEAGVLRQAIRRYGKLNQLHVAIEELSELQKELCKDLRGKGTRDAIAEEIADAEIMLEQLKRIYHNDGSVKKWRRAKVARLARRIIDGEG